MALPDPRLGLVISYNYLWHHEHHAGRDEGTKSRPCVIVLAIESQADGTTMVRVAPVTHRLPRTLSDALEIPAAARRHLRLDDARSWVILDDVNEFAWPAFDLRPIPPSRDHFAYGSSRRACSTRSW
jgi:mRNA-degrading endonuclease toxin of MazEF toxin-antitoxin module